MENIQNIAYLGPAGSYTEMAMDFFVNKYDIQAHRLNRRLSGRLLSSSMKILILLGFCRLKIPLRAQLEKLSIT